MSGTVAAPSTAPGAGPIGRPGAALAETIQKEQRGWDRAATRFGILHWLTLTIVLVVPLVIAAEASIGETPLWWLKPWIPILALAVTAAAALKEKVAPATYWHNYRSDCQKASDLRAMIIDLPPNSATDYEAYQRDWAAIEKTHRDHSLQP
jgi:hypothetical protein